MKKYINKLTIMLLLGVTLACVDESKDPIKFDEISKGILLALRGDAQDNLNDTGCTNSFYKNNIIGDEVFSFEADFLSEDQEALQEVQVYASIPGGNRVQVATVPASAFTFPTGSKTKRGTISVDLATILGALSLNSTTAANLKSTDIKISSDILLKDGSKVLASAATNSSLFESVIFQPAMNLTYCANDVADFEPVATTKMLGVKGSVVPLRGGVSDTLHIKYDQAEIKTAPSVSFAPTSAGTVGPVAALPYKGKKNEFYVIYTAAGTYTGAVTATVSGATAIVAGVELTQDDKTQTINVDNTAPVITTNVGSHIIGKGQFITLKVSYNEKMSAKAADAVKATISGQGLETITDAPFEISSDGLSASLIYIFKLDDPQVPATHGPLTVTFSGGADAAGNAAPAPTGSIVVDVNAPPAPTLTLGGGYDLGTQIRWSATETRDNTPVTGNPGGDQTGKVYFVAIATGEAAPTNISIDQDGVATWTMATGVTNKQTGIISITNSNGNSANPTFTPFTANGTLDIYAVFLGNTGNRSEITAAPQLTAVQMD
ncbi:MAG TPA: hypothetical protein PKN99_08985 [Cyclobacteriaceae bacterium]|nr:hypothetical protein [Cyclobacteriaceae bacterium]